ncbi:hypothetical protein [uncultured Tessaracoccus sp.]|uniref:hypothetical protein n=1 Tax=uncultured Tessaracoccus sp. TaxID=905023 RepID=UPI00261F3929|nr:hypothetical protein [uncultured Tessaracoccus sp.]
MAEFDKAVRRRTVVQGMAWSVPAVVAANHLPAFAASACIDHAESWGGHFTASHLQSTRIPLPGTKITNDSIYAGNLDGDVIRTDRLPEVYRQYPWVNSFAVISQSGDATDGSILKLTFPQPAYCVEFLLHDIDSQRSGPRDLYQDSVTVTADGGAVNAVAFNAQHIRIKNNNSSSVTVESPHELSSLSSQYEWDMYKSTNGTAAISIVGPINGLSIQYRNVSPYLNRGSRHNYQQMAVSNIKYSINRCDCGAN